MSDTGNAVVAWFGDGFARLHPKLQALHRDGGRLVGPVLLEYGSGAAHAIGRRLARKLGLPGPGYHELEVEIRHDAQTLWWTRRFDGAQVLRSSFRPQGCWPEGHWIERTGAMEFKLSVDIIDGGWHWRPQRMRLRGLPLPLRLVPRATAYKRIENERYRFHVAFSLPVIGEVLSYSGLLELTD